MKRILLAIFEVDVFLLNRMLWLRTFCEEWFSWTCRGMERGLVVLYALGGYTGPFGHHASRLDATLAWVTTLCIGFVAAMMWQQQKEPDAMRIARRLTSGMAVVRVGLIGLAALGLVMWIGAHDPPVTVVYAMFQYSVALPTGGNRRGRRRKLAMAKLREMFGNWLPVPEGSRA